MKSTLPQPTARAARKSAAPKPQAERAGVKPEAFIRTAVRTYPEIQEELARPIRPLPPCRIMIPLTMEDADDWARASKAKGKTISEWARSYLAAAACIPSLSKAHHPKAVKFLPPATGNIWAACVHDHTFRDIQAQAKRRRLSVELWAYRELKAEWERIKA